MLLFSPWKIHFMSYVFMCYVKCIARVFAGKPNRTVLKTFSKQYGEGFVRFSSFGNAFRVNKYFGNALLLRFRRREFFPTIEIRPNNLKSIFFFVRLLKRKIEFCAVEMRWLDESPWSVLLLEKFQAECIRGQGIATINPKGKTWRIKGLGSGPTGCILS